MSESWTVGFILAVVSSICWAGADISRKKITSEMSATVALVGIMLAQIPLVLPLMGAAELGLTAGFDNPVADVLFVPFPSFGGEYLLYALGSIVLNVGANLLFLRAVQISPLSLTTPYLSFTPVFSALVAFVLLGQTITGWGIIGIMIVCVGAFFLNPGSKDEGPLAPLKALWTERGSLYMVIVAVLWSITPIIDKKAADLTSPIWHTFVLAFGIAVIFAAWFTARREASTLWSKLSVMPLLIVAAGFFLIGALALQLGSYAFIEIAYVETVKRAIGVVAAMAAGYFWFKEEDIARRFLGAGVMVLGVAIVLFGGN